MDILNCVIFGHPVLLTFFNDFVLMLEKLLRPIVAA